MSEEFANHSEQVVDEGQQQDFQQQDTQQTPDTTQEQYFEVKYNKEPVRVSYDEAPDYIQKGMNYDKVQGRLSEYEQNLERVARLAGYESHDQMLVELDRIEQEQERQRYEQAGIDPDMFNQLLETHPDIQFAREQRAKQEQEQQFQSEAAELFSEFPNLKPDQINPEVFQLKQDKGLSLLDAYLRVNYKNLGQQAEQQAIQKIQSNQLTSPGALGGEGTDHKSSYSQLSAKEKADLRARVLRGENVQL